MGGLAVVAYAAASAIIVALLHHLYTYLRDTLTVRKTTHLSDLYAKKYQALLLKGAAGRAPAEPDDKAARAATLASFAEALDRAPDRAPDRAFAPVPQLPAPIDSRALPDPDFLPNMI